MLVSQCGKDLILWLACGAEGAGWPVVVVGILGDNVLYVTMGREGYCVLPLWVAMVDVGIIHRKHWYYTWKSERPCVQNSSVSTFHNLKQCKATLWCMLWTLSGRLIDRLDFVWTLSGRLIDRLDFVWSCI